MKKIAELLTLVLCGVLISCVLIGCAGTETGSPADTSPVHAVIILQPISTVPVITIESVEALLKKACSVPGSSISVLVADGLPWKYASLKSVEIDTSLSITMQEQILEERVQELAAIVSTAVAVNPESDLRTAVEMASRELHSYDDNADLELIICGSGINTVAPLTMQDIVLSTMDIDEVIQNLREGSYIVDLEDVSITLCNFGDTCGVQKALLNKDKESLACFWKKVFVSGNAKSVVFKNDLPSSLKYEGLPEVSTVPVIEICSSLESLTKEHMKEVEVVSFDQESIAFESGTSTLVDEEKAKEAISVIAEYMIENEIHALLVGSTAKVGDLESSITLSYERSKVIETLFLKEGVNEECLTVIGTGWLSCFYSNDVAVDGSLVESIAQSNRACIWVHTPGELADQIMNDEDFTKFIVD